MDPYLFAKDFVVPLVSPLIAVATLFLLVVQERRKYITRKEIELQHAADAIYRDLLELREAYQLFGSIATATSETVEKERVEYIRETAQRIFDQLHTNPSLYEKYFLASKSRINDHRLPLLQAEAGIRFRGLNVESHIDNHLLFFIYLLLYAYEQDYRRLAETAGILDTITETEPEFYSEFWRPKTAA